MLPLARHDHGQLRPWFEPERPGPLVWSHIMRTGHGRCLVDRWPNPRTVLAEVAGNVSLRGDPGYLSGLDEPMTGFVEAPESFLAVLREMDPGLHVWYRVISELAGASPRLPQPAATVRRLAAADADGVVGLSEDIRWVASTLGGPVELARSELAWGAFVAGRLVSVAVPFYLGEHYEDVGVVTEQAFRRRGLSTACAAGVITDVRARGRRASWTTSPDNTGSVGVAARLGFRPVREDVLYLLRTPIPGA
ncbi:MAG: GNAT family N-acetyltransferase [Actinomycetota bacterium]|nr:GNAT family N-acetyltransferase [Actinomycetota bacterium]